MYAYRVPLDGSGTQLDPYYPKDWDDIPAADEDYQRHWVVPDGVVYVFGREPVDHYEDLASDADSAVEAVDDVPVDVDEDELPSVGDEMEYRCQHDGCDESFPTEAARRGHMNAHTDS